MEGGVVAGEDVIYKSEGTDETSSQREVGILKVIHESSLLGEAA